MIFLQLFWSFVQVGLFSIGGGYAALPLIQNQVVNIHGWLDMNTFTDLVTISEMTPGPIALNAATFVGTLIAGLPGSLVATFSCILPSCIIVSILAQIYARFQKGRMMQGILATLRPAVVALIASAGFSILMQVIFPTGVSALASVNWFGLILAAAAFFLLRKFRLNPIAAIALCGAVGLAYGLIFPT